MSDSDFMLTVTGDIGPYKAGQKLATDADIVAYYRTVLKEGGEDSPLTDERLLEIIKSFDGDDEDAEVERVEAIEALSNINGE